VTVSHDLEPTQERSREEPKPFVLGGVEHEAGNEDCPMCISGPRLCSYCAVGLVHDELDGYGHFSRYKCDNEKCGYFDKY